MAHVDSIRVEELLEDRTYDLRLELVAGREGLSRRIVSARIQKPGLALAGFTAHIHPGHEASMGVARHVGLRPTDIIEGGERRWEGPLAPPDP